MPKSRKLRNSRKSKSLKRNGNKCSKCPHCGGEGLYVKKSGYPAYCICKKCGKSNFV